MTNTRDDRDLRAVVQAARSRDPEALAELCRIYYSDIYSYFYYRVQYAEDAQDLTHDLFLKMVDSIASFDVNRGTSFRAWLFRIAHNLLVDYHRRQTIRQHEPLTEFLINPRDQPAAVAERQLTQERLRYALYKLIEDQRQVILLKFIEGLSNAEVAQILGKTEGAVNGLQYRALRSLRGILGQQ